MAGEEEHALLAHLHRGDGLVDTGEQLVATELGGQSAGLAQDFADGVPGHHAQLDLLAAGGRGALAGDELAVAQAGGGFRGVHGREVGAHDALDRRPVLRGLDRLHDLQVDVDVPVLLTEGELGRDAHRHALVVAEDPEGVLDPLGHLAHQRRDPRLAARARVLDDGPVLGRDLDVELEQRAGPRPADPVEELVRIEHLLAVLEHFDLLREPGHARLHAVLGAVEEALSPILVQGRVLVGAEREHVHVGQVAVPCVRGELVGRVQLPELGEAGEGGLDLEHGRVVALVPEL